MAKPSPSLLAVSAFTVVFLGGFWWQVIPLARQFGQVEGEVDGTASQTVSAIPTVQPQLTLDQQKLEQTRQLAEVLLPKDDAEYDLSIQVEALAKSVGVTLSSIGITADPTTSTPQTAAASAASAATASTSMKKLTVGLTVSGTYSKIQQFLQGLVSINRLIQIDQLQVANSGAGNVDQVSAQISAFAYYLPSSTNK